MQATSKQQIRKDLHPPSNACPLLADQTNAELGASRCTRIGTEAGNLDESAGWHDMFAEAETLRL